MVIHSSSYWKKRAPHKQMEFIDDRIVIRPYQDDLPLVEKSYFYEGLIIPNRMIKNRAVYEITKLHPMFYINGFLVMTENSKVRNIILFGYHPNRDPKTSLYCLSNDKKDVIYDEIYFNRLVTNIKTYYLDDCFYTPSLKYVDYKKLKSIALQLNQGE
jgi:hypothetical protein